jgi:small-conductance mechanosensitive channel
MELLADWRNFGWSLLLCLIAGAAGLVAHYIIFSALRRLCNRTNSVIDRSLIEHAYNPAKLILPVLAIFFVAPTLPLDEDHREVVRHLLALGLIGGIGWLLTSLLYVLEDVIAAKYRTDVEDNLMARRIKTQVQVFRRIAVSVIGLVTFAAMLMTFPTVWNVGAGLFASAGAAGVVVGLAARPALTNLIAGVQIALTEPIRLDDVVIVENEYGRIEEIQTAYVIVRLWDLRRMVVPLSYFLEKPFQNWTRSSTDLLGTVFIYLDYTIPVEPVRQQLHAILKESELWDGKVWGLQVTDAKEHTVELRALMSAPNSSKAFDLRCYVRERLIAFVQENYPDSLPRVRNENCSADQDEQSRMEYRRAAAPVGVR